MCVCDCEVTVKPRKVAREVESLRERETSVKDSACGAERERKGEVYILGGKRALFCGVRGRKCRVEKETYFLVA